MKKTIMSLLGLFIILMTNIQAQEFERFYNEKYDYHVEYPIGSFTDKFDTDSGTMLVNNKLGIIVTLTAGAINDPYFNDLTEVYNMEVAELLAFDPNVNFFALNNQKTWYAISGQNNKIVLTKKSISFLSKRNWT